MRIIVCFLPLLPLSLAANPCYFPNGQLAPQDYPCDPTSEESACCGETALCLTNKLCRTPQGNLVRGTCTDKNWNTAECALYCLNLVNAGKDLISCSNVTGSDPQYCCEGEEPFCCDTGKGRFPVLPANPQVWAKWDASASSVVVLLQQTSAASSATSTSSSAGTSSLPTSSTATVPTATRSSVATTPTTFTSTVPTAATATAAGETTPPSPPGLPIAAQAGIGVSVGVAVILLGALGFVLWKLRQNKKVLQAERERAGGMMAEHGAEPPAGYDSKNILDGTPRSEMDGGYGRLYYGDGDSRARLELPATPGRA